MILSRRSVRESDVDRGGEAINSRDVSRAAFALASDGLLYTKAPERPPSVIFLPCPAATATASLLRSLSHRAIELKTHRHTRIPSAVAQPRDRFAARAFTILSIDTIIHVCVTTLWLCYKFEYVCSHHQMSRMMKKNEKKKKMIL